MTSSAGTSGLIFAGSPPRSAIASRMAARSTTAGHAGEVLHDHARRREGDLLAGLGLGVPARELLDVGRLDRAVALGAQQVLEQHLEAEGQPRDVELRLQRVEAEDRVLAIADLQACRGRRTSSGARAWSGSFQASSGSSTKGSPSGVVKRSEVLVEGRDAVRAQQPGERDERGVRQAEPTDGGGRSPASRSARPPTSATRTRRRRGRATAPRVPRPPPRRRDEVVHLGHRERRRDEILVEPSRSSRRRAGGRGRPRRTARRRRSVSRTTVNPRRSPPSACPSRADAQAVGAAEDADVRLRPPRLLHRAPASVRRMNSALVRPSSAARRARASSRSGSR